MRRHVVHHAFQAIFLSALGVALAGLVLVKSLPEAVAPSFAVKLNPNSPKALLGLAEVARAKLIRLKSTQTPAEPKRQGLRADALQETSNTIAALPPAEDTAIIENAPDEGRQLRRQIVDLATRALQNDPLNAQALRLLGEQAESPESARELMSQALKRSRRESLAVMWLLNDSFIHKDYDTAIGQADLVLRAREGLFTSVVFRLLAQLADTPEAQPVLIKRLLLGPVWRRPFLQSLPRLSKRAETPLVLLSALKEGGAPPANQELTPYLLWLIQQNAIDQAYDAWLQFLPPSEAEDTGFIVHRNFEAEPSGLPFDWHIGPGLNALGEVLALEGTSALHLQFAQGRVRFPQVSQLLVLGPGHYRLEGRLRGQILGKRGLRWQVRCAAGAGKILGETDMLLGQSHEWRVFSFDVEVPEEPGCEGQALHLFHDARSASEEFLEGEVWFTGLDLRRVVSDKTADANLEQK